MKFSIITPSFNSERFLRETIESVLAQKGNFEIQYILADGGSTDRTLEIFKEYQQKNTDPRITFVSFSEKDRGMYDAINKGFARATGDVFAWINSDDIYLPGAFAAIAKSFETFANVEWIAGQNTLINEHGRTLRQSPCFVYNRAWIAEGVYGRYAPFITQETVFWRRSLWQKSGPLDAHLRLAGDYKLWISFAKEAELVSLQYPVSAFRRHRAQLSAMSNQYRTEQARVSVVQKTALVKKIMLFFWLTNHFRTFTFVWKRMYALFFCASGTYIALTQGVPVLRKTSSYIA